MKLYSCKILSVFFFIALTISSVSGSQTTQNDDWKTAWENTINGIDSTFHPIRNHFRLMQSYQNEATEEQIIADIDSLQQFIYRVNSAIDLAYLLKLPDSDDGRNAAETVRLKIEALKEYTEQCKLQIEVNNRILQKKLKNESLDFKVTQIADILSDIKPYPLNRE